MMLHLMSVGLVEDGSAEDDDIADDAEAVEDAQAPVDQGNISNNLV